MIVAGLALWRGLTSLAKMAIGGALVLLIVLLFYEGIGPWKPPRPLSWIVPSIGISGRVDRVRDEATRQARIRCEGEKEASRLAAERFDGEENARRLASMAKQLQAANRRAEEARSELEQFERDVAEEDVAASRPVDACRLGPRAAGGLQPRKLPYPQP
jgi:hypothetical protein